jgi:hypothetical protein
MTSKTKGSSAKKSSTKKKTAAKTKAPKASSRKTRRSRTDAPLIIKPQRRQPTHEQIAERAYELFERRGREHGHDVEDWHAAETELTGE